MIIIRTAGMLEIFMIYFDTLAVKSAESTKQKVKMYTLLNCVCAYFLSNYARN